jgi:hypothetical protein
MGFITPELPNVDHDTWCTLPRVTRLQVVTRHWVEHGFGQDMLGRQPWPEPGDQFPVHLTIRHADSPQ